MYVLEIVGIKIILVNLRHYCHPLHLSFHEIGVLEEANTSQPVMNGSDGRIE